MTVHIPFTILVIYALSLYVTMSVMYSFVLLLWKLLAFGRQPHFTVWDMEFFLVTVSLTDFVVPLKILAF